MVQRLLQLSDLKQLGDVALLELANTAQIKSLSKGKSIAVEQQGNRHVYLISGEIELSAGGKDMQHIVAGTDRALLPLFRVHTRGAAAVSGAHPWISGEVFNAGAIALAR